MQDFMTTETKKLTSAKGKSLNFVLLTWRLKSRKERSARSVEYHSLNDSGLDINKNFWTEAGKDTTLMEN